MGDLAEYWNDHRDYKRSIRDKWQGANAKFITDWADINGIFHKQLKGSQIRLYGYSTLDVWPQSLKWHNMTANQRGQSHNQDQLKKLFEEVLL